MSDVSLRVLAPLFDALEREDVKIGSFLEGLDCDASLIRRARGRISWDLFVEICERTEAIFGPEEGLESVSRKHAESTRFKFLNRVLSAAATPRDLYWIGTKWMGRMLFSVVEDHIEELPDGRLREVLSIPPPYRDCPQFFWLMRGALRTAPMMLGGEEAGVEMQLRPRQATYLISLPPHLARRGMLGRLLTPRTKRSIIKVLIDQRAELQRTHRALQRVTNMGRYLAEHIELDRLGDALVDQLTGVFRCDGVEIWMRQVSSKGGAEGKLERLRASGARSERCDRELTLATSLHEVGMLKLWRPHEFDNSTEVDGLTELAPWIAIALDNARTHSALRDASRKLRDRVREQDAELVIINDTLQNAEKLASIGTLAAGIAHEINNPVGSILLSAEYARMLKGEPNSGHALWSTLDSVIDQARRCGEIVQSVLSFSRNEPSPKRVGSPKAALERAVSSTEEYARNHGVSISTDFCSEPCRVLMNAIEIEQVVVNLLRNAVEASSPHSRVALHLERHETCVEICVRDQGCGIEAQNAGQIFDPFFTTRRTQGGAGLGLSMVHGIVRNHGGSLRVASEPGQGTRIAVELPPAGKDTETDEGG